MSSFIKTDTHITIVFDDGNTTTAYTSHPNYDDILNAVKVKDWELARTLAEPIEKVKQQIQRSTLVNRVKIEDGIVYVDNSPMHNTLTKRMLDMMNEGFDIEPMSLFLNNLMSNPSYRAVNELYGFLEASNLPITEDGHFLAYKRINQDYKDIYTNTMDNSIGAVVSMSRHEVDDDKDRTCSVGLHFCAREYLNSYGTGSNNRTVIVKINPADVVSIPSDYNNAKGRCCKYEVISELEHSNEEKLESAFKDTSSEPEAKETNSSFIDNVASFIDDNLPVDDSVYVYQIDVTTGDIVNKFVDVKRASLYTGVNAGNIRKVIKKQRRSAGGFIWQQY